MAIRLLTFRQIILLPVLDLDCAFTPLLDHSVLISVGSGKKSAPMNEDLTGCSPLDKHFNTIEHFWFSVKNAIRSAAQSDTDFYETTVNVFWSVSWLAKSAILMLNVAAVQSKTNYNYISYGGNS